MKTFFKTASILFAALTLVIVGVFGTLLLTRQKPVAYTAESIELSTEGMPITTQPIALNSAIKTQTVQAIIKPINIKLPLTWSLDWNGTGYGWTVGKNITDYVDITVSEEDPRLCTVEFYSYFQAPINLTVKVDDHASVSRTIQIDCKNKVTFEGVQFKDSQIGNDEDFLREKWLIMDNFQIKNTERPYWYQKCYGTDLERVNSNVTYTTKGLKGYTTLEEQVYPSGIEIYWDESLGIDPYIVRLYNQEKDVYIDIGFTNAYSYQGEYWDAPMDPIPFYSDGGNDNSVRFRDQDQILTDFLFLFDFYDLWQLGLRIFDPYEIMNLNHTQTIYDVIRFWFYTQEYLAPNQNLGILGDRFGIDPDEWSGEWVAIPNQHLYLFSIKIIYESNIPTVQSEFGEMIYNVSFDAISFPSREPMDYLNSEMDVEEFLQYMRYEYTGSRNI